MMVITDKSGACQSKLNYYDQRLDLADIEYIMLRNMKNGLVVADKLDGLMIKTDKALTSLCIR